MTMIVTLGMKKKHVECDEKRRRKEAYL